MTWKPIFPEGITPVQRANALALHCDDRLKLARSLKEMTADWKFFTVGCVYTYGGLDYNIIAEYTQTHEDNDCCVMTITANRPIFTNMCTPGWPDKDRGLERELCAVPLEYWEGLRDRVGQTGMVDRKRGRYAQATIQELEIVDHLAVDNAIVAAAKPPTVMITAFGIDSMHHRVAFAARTSGPFDKAVVIKLPFREETRRIGRAILAGENPFTTVMPQAANPADVARKIQEAEEKS